jgi:hypothetical protein
VLGAECPQPWESRWLLTPLCVVDTCAAFEVLDVAQVDIVKAATSKTRMMELGHAVFMHPYICNICHILASDGPDEPSSIHKNMVDIVVRVI